MQTSPTFTDLGRHKKYQIINQQSHLKATIPHMVTSVSCSKLLLWNCVYALLVFMNKKYIYLLAKALL